MNFPKLKKKKKAKLKFTEKTTKNGNPRDCH